MTPHAKAGTAGSTMRQATGLGRNLRGALATLVALLVFAGIGASAASASSPTLTIDPVTTHSITTAHLSGTVEVPADGFETYWCLEYAEEGLQNWGGFCFQGPVQPGETRPVETDVSGLKADTHYEARLSALNFNEFVEEHSTPNQTFTTDPAPNEPALSVEPATEVEYTTAHLEGEIDPEGGNEETGGAFVPIHWALEVNREGEGWNQVEGGTLEGAAAETETTTVHADPTGLVPASNYKFRLDAHYAGIEATPGEGEFETKAVAKPTATLESPSPINPPAGRYFFAGHVNPNAPKSEGELGGTEPEEEAIKAAFHTTWRFECEPGCNVPGGELGADNTSHLVSGEAEGLQPNTVYTLTLHAENVGGEAVSEAKTFKTPQAAPVVLTGTYTPEGTEAVNLRAYVNRRNGTITDCQIEYGPTTSYGQGASCPGAEVQTLTVSAVSGQYKLSLGGSETGNIFYNASAATVQSKIEQLGPIGTGGVLVTGGPGDAGGSSPYHVFFIGELLGKSIEQLEVKPGFQPLGGTATVAILPNRASVAEILNLRPSNAVQTLGAPLTGLTSDATYHFRFLVTSDGGTTQSPDASFETLGSYQPPASCPNEARRVEQHSTSLPECRAYEQVSPPNKSGGDVIADSQRTRVAGDGSAAAFSSLVGFGDQRGTSVASDYESVRDPSGWSTHAITPPQEPTSVIDIANSIEPQYEGGFSADLDRGAFLAVSPLTEDPGVAEVPNLYVRDDLRSAGFGSYTLASGCPRCAETSTHLSIFREAPGGTQPFFADASADFGHVLFESQQPLTAEVADEAACLGSQFFELSECPGNLYESDHGAVRLVGLVPPSGQTECGPGGPICEWNVRGSQAGQGAGAFQGQRNLTPNVISTDGSKAFFTVPSSPRSFAGALYMRQDHETTVRLDVSERTGEVGTPASQPATYWGASDDGSRVFFTSNQALTDDSPLNHTNLYMYDTAKPASDAHNLTLLSADGEPSDGGNVQNLLGMSSDGHYVYFAANGQLAAGAPRLGNFRSLYVWHDGTLRYVAVLRDPADLIEDTNTAGWEPYIPIARVTPDGRHLLFSDSAAELGPTGYDQGSCSNGVAGSGCHEFYLYSYPDQRLACATCNPEGAVATADASIGQRKHQGAARTSSAQDHPLSDDGRHLFFSTKEAFVPSDTNGSEDVYSYDAVSGTVHLISSGTDEADSYFMGSSADGSGAFFLTRQQLTGTDTDGAYDLYDANVNGGFAEPPPAPEICQGEGCQGSPAPQSTPTTPGSASAKGPGNPPVNRHCPKGKIKRHGKCVTRKHRKSKHHKRANANRRTSR